MSEALEPHVVPVFSGPLRVDVSARRVVQVKDVEPGQLLVYSLDSENQRYIAFRVNLLHAPEDQRAAVALLGYEYAQGRRGAVLVPGTAKDPCVPLGKAILVTTPNDMTSQQRWDRYAGGELLVARSGLLLVVRMPPPSHEMRLYDVATGNVVEDSAQSVRVPRWGVGVAGVDGNFVQMFDSALG